MPIDVVKFSFAAGELSEDLHGRGDLEGFHFGYRKGLNVFVDWRGGVKTRPGTLMCEPVFEDSANPGVRLTDFSFNADPEDNYLLIWLHHKLRIVQEDSYITENFFRDGGELLTWFLAGDLIRVYDSSENYLFTGEVVDDNTVKVAYKNETVDLSSSFQAKRVYTVPTPFNGADLHDLKFEQFRDELIVSHIDYQTRVLQRTLYSDFSVGFAVRAQTFLESKVTTGKTSTVRDRTEEFADNTGGFQWTVAIVEAGGREFPVPFHDGVLVADLNVGTKVAELSWDSYAGAELYRVYGTAFKPLFNAALSPVQTGPGVTEPPPPLPPPPPPVDPMTPDPPDPPEPPEPPEPEMATAKALSRNTSADLILGTSGTLRGAAYDGTYIRAMLRSPYEFRAFDMDGNVVDAATITYPHSSGDTEYGFAHWNSNYILIARRAPTLTLVNGTQRIQYHDSSGARGENLFSQGNDLVNLIAVGDWLYALRASGLTLRYDPVAVSLDSQFSFSASSRTAYASDGITLWALASDARAKAYNLALGVLTPDLDQETSYGGSVIGSFYLPDEDRIYMVRSNRQAIAFDLVEPT